MGEKMWFGNVAHAQWAPVPATGMTRTSEGFSEEFSSDGGGLYINRSRGNHAVYEGDFPMADSSEYDGIETYQRYADGEWGSEFLRFVDPMIQDQNVLTAPWAAPGLAELGHKRIYDTVPTFSDTGANIYGKPIRKATYEVTGAANAVPTKANSVFTLLIPPTSTLWFGASGSISGDARLRVQPILLNGTLAGTTDITLSTDGAVPGFTNGFVGGTYKAVRIYITRTTTSDSTITLSSMWSQILPTGTTPVILRHIPGKGHSGLQFRGSARVVTYTMTDRHLAGLNFSLAEVEPWS